LAVISSRKRLGAGLFRYKSGGSTSTLAIHGKSHQEAWAKANTSSDSKGSSGQSTLGTVQPLDASTIQQLHNLLLLLIVGCRLPFTILTRPEFKRFLSRLNPAYRLPSKQAFSVLLQHTATIIEGNLKSKLSKAVAASFTMDGWTQHLKHFLAITAHYITTDGKYRDSVLPLLYVDTRHTALEYLGKFKSSLASFLGAGCAIPALGGVCTDNAANMKSFGEQAGMTWISCICHTINLFLRDIIDCTDFSPAVERLRKVVTAFRRSSQYMDALHAEQKKNGKSIRTLMLDVETRWNSLFLMCQRAYAERDHIDSALKAVGDEGLVLSGRDWQAIGDLAMVLSIFFKATETLSASRTVTLSLVHLFLNKFLTTLQARNDAAKADSALAKKTKRSLLDNFEVRFGDYLKPDSPHSMATVLDPEWQHGFIGDKDAVFEAITTKLKAMSLTDTSESSSTSPATVRGDDGSYAPKRRRALDEELGLEAPAPRSESASARLSIDDQVASYRKVQDRLCPLAFWTKRVSTHPELANFALSLLSIPASETPCERSFSWAGAFFTDERNRMFPTTLAHLMFTYANHPQLRQDRNPDEENEDPL